MSAKVLSEEGSANKSIRVLPVRNDFVQASPRYLSSDDSFRTLKLLRFLAGRNSAVFGETCNFFFPIFLSLKCLLNLCFGSMTSTFQFSIFTLIVLFLKTVWGQNGTLGLSDGFLSFNTSTFNVQLVKDSQTLYSLKPIGGGSFDFIPADKMTLRANNGNYHLGDITFRARKVGSTAWVSGDTSAARKVVKPVSVAGASAAASLAPTLPSNSLLNITRRWVVQNNQLELLFDVTNSQTVAVEIGALGAPLEFNNVRNLLLYFNLPT